MLDDNLKNKELIKGYYIRERKKSFFKRIFFNLWILIFLFIIGSIVLILLYKTGFTFSQIRVNLDKLGPDGGILPEYEQVIKKDPDRINILLLGIRGVNDPNGGLLADAIMVISIKESTKKVALISIPRDLYIEIPGKNFKEKINAAYAFGEEQYFNGGGLLASKVAVSGVTGQYIDYAVSIDFKAFQEIVDSLGGIDIYLDESFSEPLQWAGMGEFYLPAGKNHLNGETSLYYIRSRYSTSDFDRMRRQQQVLASLKDKAFSLGFLANPLKIYKLLDILGNNVKTDMGIDDINKLINLSLSIDKTDIKHRFLDTTSEGLLYSSNIDGIYILLPKNGDYEKIHEVCKNIFN
ncbi:MAG: LCP family protein [Spirochaetota bacterium]|nr:LCP family protein [Spirochaetota bacterium]